MEIKEIFKKIKIFFHSFAWGMKSANKEILESKTQGSDPDIRSERPIYEHNVFNDLLNGEETEMVKEFRDRTYRIYRESFNYKTRISPKYFDDNTAYGDHSEYVKVSKIERKDSYNMPIVERNNGDQIRLVQYQQIYDLKYEDKIIEMKGGKVRPERNISIIFDDFKSSVEPDDFLSMLVLRKSGEKDIVDLYFEEKEERYGVTENYFYNDLSEKYNNQENKVEEFEFNRIEFIPDNAFGEDNIPLYSYELINPEFINITKFNGNYVAHFKVDVKRKDIIEKYRVPKVTEQYDSVLPKSDTIDFGVAMKQILK